MAPTKRRTSQTKPDVHDTPEPKRAKHKNKQKQVGGDREALFKSQMAKRNKLTKFKKRMKNITKEFRRGMDALDTDSKGDGFPPAVRAAVAREAVELQEKGVRLVEQLKAYAEMGPGDEEAEDEDNNDEGEEGDASPPAAEAHDDRSELLEPLEADTIMHSDSPEAEPPAEDTDVPEPSQEKAHAVTEPLALTPHVTSESPNMHLHTTIKNLTAAAQDVTIQANTTIQQIAQRIGCSLPRDSDWTERDHDSKSLEVALAAEDAQVNAEVKHVLSENLEARKMAQLSFAEQRAKLATKGKTSPGKMSVSPSTRADQAVADAIDNICSFVDEYQSSTDSNHGDDLSVMIQR